MKTDQNKTFDLWLAQHAGILHHVANGFAEGADRHDLLQELMLALWRAIPNFRGDAQVSTFIYRVAHNTALTWRRTQRNYRQRLDAYELAVPPPAEERDEREELVLTQVYAAIRQLPPLDRSLILLHLDGLRYAEIAEIHGLTESNVGARLSRTKQKLIQTLEALTDELR